MRVARWALLLACSFTAPAWAQTVVPEQPATLRCLTPLRPELSQPEYPFEAWKAEEGGRVVVDLEFSRPDARPSVKVVEREGRQSLVDAVEQHVRKLRVPCLEAAEGPARLRQEYVFRPDRREVVVGPDTYPDELRRQRLLACVLHVGGKQAPAYPMNAERAQVQGRVLASLSYFAADQPPRAEVFSRDSAWALREAIAEFVKGYRMPCHEGGAVRVRITYVFRIEREAYGFKDVSFREYIASIKNIRLQRVNFDTGSMTCPFDVRVHYFKPYARNEVGELDQRVAARVPLLEWLRDSELDVPARTADAIFGDNFVLTIPCVKINLTPKE